MKREFIEKMIEAKKCEMEAVCAILPKKVRPHMEIIQKELTAMAMECLLNEQEKESGKRVRQVNLD